MPTLLKPIKKKKTVTFSKADYHQKQNANSKQKLDIPQESCLLYSFPLPTNYTKGVWPALLTYYIGGNKPEAISKLLNLSVQTVINRITTLHNENDCYNRSKLIKMVQIAGGFETSQDLIELAIIDPEVLIDLFRSKHLQAILAKAKPILLPLDGIKTTMLKDFSDTANEMTLLIESPSDTSKKAKK
jgi:hypothetical protein